MKDNLRAKGTVELDCVKCGWTSWFNPLDPKVLEAADTGNFVCDQCLGIRVSHLKHGSPGPEPKLKVLFLDIDGVLTRTSEESEAPITSKEVLTVRQILDNNPGDLSESLVLGDLRALDPKAVALLNDLLARSQASLVISSAWRILYSSTDLQLLLNHHGFTGLVSSVTPTRIEGSSREIVRGDLIQAWLSEHEKVDQFVILDDDDDMAHLKSHLVRIDPSLGLTEEDVGTSLRLLNS